MTWRAGGVARHDLPGDGPTVPIDHDAEHELREVAAPVPRVPPLAPRSLLVAVDVRARGVHEHDLQALREQVPVFEEQLAFEGIADVEQEPGGPIEVLKRRTRARIFLRSTYS
jgi:hypothetical protein